MTIKDYKLVLKDAKWSSHTLPSSNLTKGTKKELIVHSSGKIILRKAR